MVWAGSKAAKERERYNVNETEKFPSRPIG
jgi:hypothetical protein